MRTRLDYNFLLMYLKMLLLIGYELGFLKIGVRMIVAVHYFRYFIMLVWWL